MTKKENRETIKELTMFFKWLNGWAKEHGKKKLTKESIESTILVYLKERDGA